MEYKVKYNNDKNVNKFFNYLEDVETEIRKNFIHSYCLFIKMEFQKDDNNMNDNNLYPINSIITFYNPINDNSERYKVDNILKKGIDSFSNGFPFMIENINNECFKDIKYKQTDLESKKQSILDDIKGLNGIKKIIRKSEDISNLSTQSQSFFIVESYPILELLDIFDNDIKNGQYEEILKNEGFVNDINIVKKLKNGFKNDIYNGKISNDKTLSSSNKNDLNEIFLNPLNSRAKNKIFNDLLTKISEQYKNKKYDKSYISGIKINENLAVFTSNKLLSNKKDYWSLLLYDLKSNQKTIKKGYSLLLSQNNSTLINIPKSIKKNNENIKLLLFACKKYVHSQINGIILSKINLDNIKDWNSQFYESKNFEVYCFCPILIFPQNSIFQKNIQKIETAYFMVGGFDRHKKRGIIKLYKIKSKEKCDDYTIEFIQDLIVEKKGRFKGFRGPIIRIVQSNFNGKILVICLDGNAFLFAQPELELLIKIQNEKTIIKTK